VSQNRARVLVRSASIPDAAFGPPWPGTVGPASRPAAGAMLTLLRLSRSPPAAGANFLRPTRDNRPLLRTRAGLRLIRRFSLERLRSPVIDRDFRILTKFDDAQEWKINAVTRFTPRLTASAVEAAARRAAAGVAAGGEAEGLNAQSKPRRREAPELPWGKKSLANCHVISFSGRTCSPQLGRSCPCAGNRSRGLCAAADCRR
jgi:hypothetical protein